MDRYPLTERKLIYGALHAALMEQPDLMDSEFLHDLQRSLRKPAHAEGVDVADHGAWDAWLGNAADDRDFRVGKRRTINPPAASARDRPNWDVYRSGTGRSAFVYER